MRKTLIVGGLALGLLVAGTGSADAAGTYTRGGDVLVTVAVSGGCATVTWPKDTTTTTCDSDGTYQHNIQPGNRFGAKITSHTGGSVACRVRDVESNRIIGEDSAGPGSTANCMYRAKGSTKQRGSDDTSSSGSSSWGSS
ncbi:hypothetical protein GII30_22690 [Gordonia amarae]|uniref:Ig-like domain-containing protein n=2 Tax=Gordonia amarae TaxID=36821 RepID=G7GLJ9_9ACTN|nr:hypothetical protein [Gordonia amarae]MCS3876594.1 hypothetical protein [Gordonia amarae]QHN19486.1 hypothetical protein GII35_23155 [Gordonia amarae]QHN23962.1 hypothetical protein GII34_22655 [Gordonia amarae]QHN32871.1 hypothetical protein GII32_22985 [Gordonia amarae]QHN41590.1 hypothetical protein GII30_22690 [Gordonia amarae]